MKRKFKQW